MKKQDNKNNVVKNSDHGQVFFYQTESGKTKIEVRLENETVWLNQMQMAELFDKGRSTIVEHIQNVFEEAELEEGITCRKLRQVLDDGRNYDVLHVQNKLHWAIAEKTAAEIIYDRADSKKSNMGLTTWRGEKVRKGDVSVAKNYLKEEELLSLNNLVEQYLVFAEGQARRRIPMSMNDWITKLEGFLSLNDRDILNHAGKISHELAISKAEVEYEKFNQMRISKVDQEDGDFEKAIKLIKVKIESGKK